MQPHIDKATKTIRFTTNRGQGKPPSPPKVGRGAKFRCLVCGEVAPADYVKAESMARRMKPQLMAIVTEGDGQRNYYEPTQQHQDIAARAQPDWVPSEEMDRETSALVSGRGYGFYTWDDLFTPRQLVSLTTFNDLVAETRDKIQADAAAAGFADDEVGLRGGGAGARAYAEAVSVYLAFAVDRSSSMWGSFCWWQPSGGFIAQVFTRQAVPMVWDFAEANPFSDSSGNWSGAVDWIVRALQRLRPSADGYATQEDATNIHRDEPIPISTDPPYYDNISYADLSDYYYIWMRRALREVYPDLLSTLLVPKASELVAASHRFDGDREKATDHFESGLMQAFSAMRRIIPLKYPLTLFYAFKQEEIIAEDKIASTGWETMLKGLIDAGFSIVGTWPMRTERPGGVKITVNALASSILLVCRLRSGDAPITSRREFIAAMRRELPHALREMQSGNVAPVDLAQASIGPGMAVYSRYNKVLEPNGDRLTVRTALQLINRELDAYLAEQEGYIDEDSRFAVAWFEQFAFEKGPFGQADVLARAKNTSVEGLAHAGILESGAGKVRLYSWEELDPGWEPTQDERLTVWQATHHLIERLNTHGEEGAARLLAQLPSDVAAQARQLAYRLYNICERRGWPQHARDYNALVVSWSASQEQATGFKEQYQQGELL